MAHLEFFPRERLDLAQEVKEHPDLLKLLANHKADEFEIQIAEIAAYCDVILDGEYLQSDLDNLCTILVKKLRNKRSIIQVLN